MAAKEAKAAAKAAEAKAIKEAKEAVRDLSRVHAVATPVSYGHGRWHRLLPAARLSLTDPTPERVLALPLRTPRGTATDTGQGLERPGACQALQGRRQDAEQAAPRVRGRARRPVRL